MGLQFVDELDVRENCGVVKRRFPATLQFIIGVKKSLVFLDRPANRTAELVLSQRVRAGSLQQIDGIHLVVAEIFVQRAVPFVGAAARDDIHDAADRAPKFSGIIRVNYAELLHRFLRRRAALDARSRGHVISPVHGDKVVVNVLPSKRKLRHWLDDHVRASRRCVPDLHRRRKQREINEFAPVYRQVHNLVLRDDRTDLRSRRFLKLRGRLHFYFFGNASRRQRKVQFRRLPNLQGNRLCLFAKADEHRRNSVFTRRKRRDRILAGIRCFDRTGESCSRVCGRHAGLAYRSPRGIDDLSRESRIYRLPVRG